MGKILFALVLSGFALYESVPSAYAQSGMGATIDRVTIALGDGDSKELAAELAPKLDLRLLDQERLYSTDEATAILKNFFTRYPPKSFTIFENGTPKAQNAIFKGKLYTAHSTYQVTIILHLDGGAWKVIQLRIELAER